MPVKISRAAARPSVQVTQGRFFCLTMLPSMIFFFPSNTKEHN